MIIKANNYNKEFYKWVKELRKQNDLIIFLNGCFDILHHGHIKMFKSAKNFFKHEDLGFYYSALHKKHNGKVKVVVGVNSDFSISKQNKSHSLINNEDYRANFVQEFVDDVIIFDDITPSKIIWNIIPDVLIKGKEYEEKIYPEQTIMLEYLSGYIFYYDSGIDISTTKIIERVILCNTGLNPNISM